MRHFPVLVCVAVVIGAAGRCEGQSESAALQKEMAAIRAMEKLLAEVVETKNLQDAMPLSQFLEALTSRVAKAGKLTFHIERDAFAGGQAAVAGAMVRLPAVPKQMTVGTALRLALVQLKGEPTYRVDPTGVTITTRGRSLGAVHTAQYDIRDLLEKHPQRERAAQARRIVQTLVTGCDQLPSSDAGSTDPVMQLRNGHQLVVRASALGHMQVAQILGVLRRVADVAVIVQAKLYEVDDAFHTRLTKAKHVPLEELEQQFLAGKAPKYSLFKLLAKEKPVQVGDQAKLDDGATVALLSRYNVVTALPAPSNVRQGDRARQAILEGVAFTGVVAVSADRRYVHLRLTETAAQIEARHRVKVVPPGFHHHFMDDPGGKSELVPPQQIDAERVLVKETAITRLLEIPDGGSMLVAVQYRPAALAAKQRWWVLTITPRIWIEEEERQIRQGGITPVP